MPLPYTKTDHTFIARGTSNAAFTQLTGCSATRTGTTATLTKLTHGRSVGDKLLIQGFGLEEFNGVFTVATVPNADTLTYTIKQDPGANPAGTPGTVDLVTLGTAMDLTGSFGGQIVGGIQNTTTGPTVAAQLWMGVSLVANSEVDYVWQRVVDGDTAANAWIPVLMALPQGLQYVNFAVCRNTAQAVDCFIMGSYNLAT